MNIRPIILLAASALAASAAPGVLQLKDGNFVRGTMKAIRDGQIIWLHEASGVEMNLPYADMKRAVFSPDTTPDPSGDLLLLRDGGLVSGSLESLDATGAVLRTGFGATIRIPRPQIDSARLATAQPRMIFDGFPPMEKWKVLDKDAGASSWSMDKGLLSFNGRREESVSLSPDLPEAFDLRFEMAWEPDAARSPQFTLFLCAEDPKDRSIGEVDHYAFCFSRTSLYIYRNLLQHGQRNQKPIIGGRINISSYLAGRNSLRVRLVANRPSRKLHLFLNGMQAGPEDMRDTGDEAPVGNLIAFHGFMQSPMRFRNLSLQPWTGLLGTNLAANVVRGESDQIDVTSGDHYVGKIIQVRSDPKGERVVDLTSPVLKSTTVLSLPVRCIRHMVFAKADPPPAAQPPPGGFAAMVRLRDGSNLDGVIRTCQDGHLSFRFGNDDLNLPLEALVEIVPAGSTPISKETPKRKNSDEEEE